MNFEILEFWGSNNLQILNVRLGYRNGYKRNKSQGKPKM